MRPKTKVNLHDTMDAVIWTDEFMKVIKENNFTLQHIDKGFMIGWFANAIIAGYDVGQRMMRKDEENKRKI